MVSSKDSVIEKAKTWAKEQSKNRKEGLTKLSNEANQTLSKAVGQPLRSARNALSNNIVSSKYLLGDDTFTALLPEDKKELQDLTKNLNAIMTNIDFATDKDGKQAEEDVKTLITNNESVYEIIEHILEQPQIQQHIANRIGKGKRMPEILQHMFKYILSKSGANPTVSELVSNILTYKMDYGNEEGEDKPTDMNSITIDLNGDNTTPPASPPIMTSTPQTKNPTEDDPRVTTTTSPVTPSPYVTNTPLTIKPNTKPPIPRDPYIDFNIKENTKPTPTSDLPPVDPKNFGDQRNW